MRARPVYRRCGRKGFTLIELLCAVVVFLILGIIVAQLLTSATLATGLSNKKQEADAQGRAIFSRLALDLSKMLLRPDVEYFLEKESGNDRLAFLSEVSGYFPAGESPGPLSVVSYRMGGGNGDFVGLQRFSKALAWAGGALGETPLAFHQSIAALSPEAVSTADLDDFEEIGPGVIRWEYFYRLKNGSLSAVPWDEAAGGTAVRGFRDVAALCVVMAVLDPAVIGRITPAEIRTLSGKLKDFDPATMSAPGALEREWQQTVDADPLVRKSGGAVRVLARWFPLSP